VENLSNSLTVDQKGKKVVYVGGERFVKLEQHAIDVSNDTRVQITPGQFVQHLVDHYSEVARENWSKTLMTAAQNDRSATENPA
jgi:hypothetical protein